MTSSTTKKCKYCISNIPEAATVCCHCRRVLNEKWYQRIQFSSLIYFIPLVVYLVYLDGTFTPEFKDYTNEVTVVEETIVLLGDTEGRRLIYRIDNKSDIKWENLKYQLITSNSERVIKVELASSPSWVVQPNSTSYFSVDSYQSEPNLTWELKIVNLEKRHF